MQITDYIAEVALGTVSAVMIWLGKREIARIDKLEQGKADKEDIRELIDRVTERLDKVAESSAATSRAVARIEGQLSIRS